MKWSPQTTAHQQLIFLASCVAFTLGCSDSDHQTSVLSPSDSNVRTADDSDPSPPDSAPETISIGRRHSIYSKQLEQERDYLVYLPQSYKNDTYLPQSYPVLYLFDGDVQFHFVTGLIGFMAESGWQIPEMIVVGIPHQNRTRELTPTNTLNDFRPGRTTQTQSDSGGGDDFLAFVTQELIPKIERDFRTRPYRILFGHSYGGLLAAHAFLSDDEVFQSFILADPSLWWDDRVLVKRLERRLEQRLESGTPTDRKPAMFLAHVTTYIAPGDEVLQSGFNNIESSVRAFESLLSESTSVRFQSEKMSDATHHSVPAETLRRGLLHIFQGYEPPPEYFLGVPEKLDSHFQTVSETVGLELLPGEQLVDMWGNAFANYDEDFQRYAVPLLKLNTRNYPHSPNAHTSLGNAYRTVGDTDNACKSFERALEIAPRYEGALAGIKELNAL